MDLLPQHPTTAQGPHQLNSEEKEEEEEEGEEEEEEKEEEEGAVRGVTRVNTGFHWTFKSFRNWESPLRTYYSTSVS